MGTENLRKLIAKWRDLADSALACKEESIRIKDPVREAKHTANERCLSKCADELEDELAAPQPPPTLQAREGEADGKS